MFVFGSLVSVLLKTTNCIYDGLWFTPLLLTCSHYPFQRKKHHPEVSSVFTW